MRDKSFRLRLAGTATGAIICVAAVACWPATADDSAAHDIAEKFAREASKADAQASRRADAEKLRAGDQDRKAQEAEMLARARAEAEQRRAEMMRARQQAEEADRQRKADEVSKQAEAARKLEEERWLAEARRKAEEEVRAAEAASRKAEAARAAEEEQRQAETRRAEAEMLRKAEAARRAEEEQRRLAEAEAHRKAEEAARIETEAKQAEAARLLAEARRRAEEERLAEVRRAEEASAIEARRQAEELQHRAQMEAEREAEAERLTARLRALRDARETSGAAAAQSSPTITGSGSHQATSGTGPWQQSGAPARHVTVLLLMEPGNRGIRRNNKSADPVLCGYRECYVSNGPDRTASLLPARKALGFFRTWGRRAGACNNSLGCVFRGVDLEYLDGIVRPVDMRVVRHDRREAQHVESTSNCRIEHGRRLTCSNGIYADDYVMWVVPEGMAAAVGPAALMRALEDDLPASERTASAPPLSRR